jgi:hypothetical protein
VALALCFVMVSTHLVHLRGVPAYYRVVVSQYPAVTLFVQCLENTVQPVLRVACRCDELLLLRWNLEYSLGPTVSVAGAS